MCFVWIWEKTAIISLYSINWLIFITETECVYCAVRAECLNIIRVNLSLRSAHTVHLCVLCGSENKQRLFPYKALTDWYLCPRRSVFTARYELNIEILYGLTSVYFFPHSVFMCFVWTWEQTAIISLYSINWLVFITETECVYCAVRAETLKVIQANSPSEGLSRRTYAIWTAGLVSILHQCKSKTQSAGTQNTV